LGWIFLAAVNPIFTPIGYTHHISLDFEIGVQHIRHIQVVFYDED
jgi:hypothetical protein